MGKHRDKFSMTICLLLFWYVLLFVAGCMPMKQVRVWQPIGGRSVSVPSFSPDGKNIVFTARPHGEMKRQIFVSLLDGTGERNLTQHQSTNWAPAWSPDGLFIFFTSNRDGQREIYRMHSDGTELENISQNAADDESFDLPPDGKDIVFERRNPGAPRKEVTLVIASADGSNQRVLLKGGWRPRWSPDGQWILHKRGGDTGAWIIRSDASEERRIDTDGLELAWTPDSKAIFYYHHPNIYFVKLDGTGKRLVLRNVDVGLGLLPRCSWGPPFGSRLAIAVNPGVGEVRKGIVVLDRHGDLVADFRQMAPHHFYHACWSIDGKTIWFTKAPMLHESTGGIYAMNEDGSGERQVIPDNVAWELMPPATEDELRTRIKEMQE